MSEIYAAKLFFLQAPVFALTGYAAASHGIPRGLATPLPGMARAKSCRNRKHKYQGWNTEILSRISSTYRFSPIWVAKRQCGQN